MLLRQPVVRNGRDRVGADENGNGELNLALCDWNGHTWRVPQVALFETGIGSPPTLSSRPEQNIAKR